ncbi:hypothetical protein FS842_010574, partial [Serendipita sp. 407]
EELAFGPARFRRGGKGDVGCTSYYPTALPVSTSTACYCGGLPVAHDSRSVLVTNNEPITAPSVAWPGGSIPQTNTTAQFLNMLLTGPRQASIPAAQRRIAAAHEEFHGRTALTARANAPQPTLPVSPATTSVTGPRLGHPSAPTSHMVRNAALLGNQPSTAMSAQTQQYLIAAIPVKYSGERASGPYIPQRLRSSLETFLDRLDTYGLIISYMASPHPEQRKGYGLIRHLNSAITTHLRRSGYLMEGAEHVPAPPANIEYQDLPWRLVWYTTKTGRNTVISDEENLASIGNLDVANFSKSPWGKGPSRPHLKGDNRVVIFAMMRNQDLLGIRPELEPTPTLSRAHAISSQQESEASALLHRCMGRRIMNGYYYDGDTPKEADNSCRPTECTVPCDPATLFPVQSPQPQVNNLESNSTNTRYRTSASTNFGGAQTSRIRPRSTSMEMDHPAMTRRRTAISTEVDVARLGRTQGGELMFPSAMLPSIRATPITSDERNHVEIFIDNVFINVSNTPDAHLIAQNEEIAATALYNHILIEGNKLYAANAPLLSIDPASFMWYHEQGPIQRLFRKDFLLFLDDPQVPNSNSAHGDGPVMATLRGALKLALADPSIFYQQSNSIGYRNINFSTSGFTDPVRMAKLWAAGCLSALHIVRTMTGPYPINPFLIYLSLETDPEMLVNKDFVSQFDPATATDFFPLLAEAEHRKMRGDIPFLLPLGTHYLETRGGQIGHAETDTVRDNLAALRHLVTITLGGVLGVSGFMGEDSHPDFVAFSKGLSESLDPVGSKSRSMWPLAAYNRDFLELLYNLHPRDPEDVLGRVQFISCHWPQFGEIEKAWEKGIRNYARGIGVPPWARWATGGEKAEQVDFSKSTGRATQMLIAMTGSDLMPATDKWHLQFVFRYSPQMNLGEFTTLSFGRMLKLLPSR